MSNFYGHLAFGLVIGVIIGSIGFFQYEFSLSQCSVVLAFCGFGSLIPDIDHENSYIHRAVRLVCSVSVFSSVLFLFQSNPRFRVGIASLSGVLVYLFLGYLKPTHRGPTHSISFAFLCGLAGIIMSVQARIGYLGAFTAVGVLSHLLLDQEFKII